MNLDAEILEFGHAPINDANHVPAPARRGCQPHLPPGLIGSLEQFDPVSALGEDPCRFEAGGPCSDHYRPPRRAGTVLDTLRPVQFAPARRVVHAGRAIVPHAVRHPDTGANAVLFATFELGDDIRIGDVRAGHRHHVEQAIADRVPRGRKIGNARRVKHGQLNLGTKTPRGLQPGRDR